MAKKFLISLFLFLTFTHAPLAGPTLTDEQINQTLKVVYDKYKNLNEGKNADYIPELAKVNSKLFGIAIVTVDGKMYSIGDATTPFSIQSISKPFAYMLALQDNGEEALEKRVGLNATGHPFNSILSIEEYTHHLQNPLVNSGAIQVTSMIKGKNSQDKWNRMLHFYNGLSDGKLSIGDAVYQSEMATNKHNVAIAELMDSYGMMSSNPVDAVERYTKACSVMVTAQQLALMGATLADGGVNPITHQVVAQSDVVRDALSQMITNGMYENSGTWWLKVGIPSKSGVGGAILSVVPRKMAIVVFSPRLDEVGNSVRGQKVIEDLSQRLGLHLLSVK